MFISILYLYQRLTEDSPPLRGSIIISKVSDSERIRKVTEKEILFPEVKDGMSEFHLRG